MGSNAVITQFIHFEHGVYSRRCIFAIPQLGFNLLLYPFDQILRWVVCDYFLEALLLLEEVFRRLFAKGVEVSSNHTLYSIISTNVTAVFRSNLFRFDNA